MTQLLVIVVYLALLLGLGLLANRLLRGTSEDYLLASHSIGPFLLLMSLFGTTMTAFALVGSTNEAYRMGVGVYGMLASASGIVHSACFFLIGVRLWSFGRRFGYTTQIQFFRDRLQCDWIGLLLFPVLVALVIPYLLIGVMSAGDFINAVTQGAFTSLGWFESTGHAVPRWLASLAICLVVLTYVFFGGMRGTAWANAMQTMFFMAVGVMTFFTVADAVGDKENLLASMQEATRLVAQENASHLTRSHLPMPLFFSFLLIPLSVAMFPHVFQHWLTARSANTFKLSIVMHPIFIMIVWLPCVLIGVWASGYGLATDVQISDERVLAEMVGRLASPLIGGLLTAGILAAIMSSLDSQFLCLGTMFTHDIVRHYGSKIRDDDRRTVLLARSFVVAVVLVTYVLSLFAPHAIFSLAIWCFSGFVGLFPLALAAVYWRRLTAAGAAAGILTMLLSWTLMFCRSGYGQNRYSFPEEAIQLMGGLAIPKLMPVVAILVLSATAMVVVSLLTRPPSQQTLKRFFGR